MGTQFDKAISLLEKLVEVSEKPLPACFLGMAPLIKETRGFLKEIREDRGSLFRVGDGANLSAPSTTLLP
jgi:hypothetical protein